MDLEKIAKWIKEQWHSPYVEKKALEGHNGQMYGSATDSEPLKPCPLCGASVQEAIFIGDWKGDVEKTPQYIKCNLPCGYESMPFTDKITGIADYNAGKLARKAVEPVIGNKDQADD